MGEQSDDGTRDDEESEAARDDEQSASPDGISEFDRAVLERDRIYDCLGHARRRYLCYLLCDRSELQIDEAAAAIADWENDDQPAPEQHREQVKLSLLHSHIPKLRAEDVVDFDPHSETLVADDADEVLTALRAVGTALTTERTSAEFDGT